MRVLIIGALIVASKAWGQYTLPSYYEAFRQPSDPEELLAHVYVEVNGDPRVAKNGETIGFVRGDILRIRKVFLEGVDRMAQHVNLVGFRADSGRYMNDIDIDIDTSEHLSSSQSQWAVDKEGKVFAVVVSSDKTLHGAIYLQRNDPQVKYVDVKINESNRVMREGEPLIVNENDKFKVDKVVTNLESNDDVEVRIVPFKSNPFRHIRQAKYYEVQFVRKKYTFGRIPLVVEAL